MELISICIRAMRFLIFPDFICPKNEVVVYPFSIQQRKHAVCKIPHIVKFYYVPTVTSIVHSAMIKFDKMRLLTSWKMNLYAAAVHSGSFFNNVVRKSFLKLFNCGIPRFCTGYSTLIKRLIVRFS